MIAVRFVRRFVGETEATVLSRVLELRSVPRLGEQVEYPDLVNVFTNLPVVEIVRHQPRDPGFTPGVASAVQIIVATSDETPARLDTARATGWQ